MLLLERVKGKTRQKLTGGKALTRKDQGISRKEQDADRKGTRHRQGRNRALTRKEQGMGRKGAGHGQERTRAPGPFGGTSDDVAEPQVEG